MNKIPCPVCGRLAAQKRGGKVRVHRCKHGVVCCGESLRCADCHDEQDPVVAWELYAWMGEYVIATALGSTRADAHTVISQLRRGTSWDYDLHSVRRSERDRRMLEAKTS